MFSRLVIEQRWIKRIELNPLFASPWRIVAAEAKIRLHSPETDLEQAEQLAERMRKKRAETPLDLGPAIVELTISFGVAHINGEKMPLDELLLRADDALYCAKEAGRNRVCTWTELKRLK